MELAFKSCIGFSIENGSSSTGVKPIPFFFAVNLREGRTPDEARLAFTYLHERLCDEGVHTLSMLFCGPNIAPGLHGTRCVFSQKRRIPHESISSGHDYGTNAGASTATQEGESTKTLCVDRRDSDDSMSLIVTVQFDQGLYHDIVESFSAPDAMFLFNAGLWGYDDWLPTMEHILRPVEVLPSQGGLSLANASKSTIVVVTSYCAEEAEDDTDTLEKFLDHGGESGCSRPLSNVIDLQDGACLPREVSDFPGTSPGKSVDKVRWLWGPEINPHRSFVPRNTACGEKSRLLFENHSWQAICLPKRGNIKHNTSVH